MERVNALISRADDGFYTLYCEDSPLLFGSGETVEQAMDELKETLRIYREEIGKDEAFVYPEWMDRPYEFNVRWDVRALLEYYMGIITPTALGRISGIHPKQLWSYLHGKTRPRKKQVEKIESSLHKLGEELCKLSFSGK